MLACIPQHAFFYDQLLLWLIPMTWRQSIGLSAAGWVAYFSWSLYDAGFDPFLAQTTHIPRLMWTAPMFYLPALCLVVWQQLAEARKRRQTAPEMQTDASVPAL